MRTTLTVFLLLISLFVQAQKSHSTAHTSYPIDDVTASQQFTKVETPNRAQYAKAFISSQLKNDRSPGSHIETVTPFGTYYTYKHLYEGKEIYREYTKVFITNKNILSHVTTLQFDGTFSQETPTDDQVWFSQAGTFVPATQTIHNVDDFTVYEQIVDNNGASLYYQDLLLYADTKDSIAQGTIFNPDPLTTAGVSYGTPYFDNSDADEAVLLAEIDTVTLTLLFDTIQQLFLLENEYLKITEHSSPDVPPVTSANGEFYYTRAQQGFEDVNAFYHITTFQDHIRSLGFLNIVNYQIHIDVHALGGGDQSNFNSFNNPPTISFGEGGVDDAEDADVIVHEYGHAISASVAPSTNFGTERKALDEANGDYFASSYSRTINPHDWEKVFSWDGHNEFWSGRSSTSTKHYPEDLAGNLYTDTDIWSSTLMQIWGDIGRDATDQILLQSMYGYAANMNMPQAAQLFVNADSLLNNGANHDDICARFNARGILSACYPVSVTEPEEEDVITYKTAYEIINSAGFSANKDDLVINILDNEVSQLELYTYEGRLVYAETMQGHSTSLSADLFPAGIYLLRLTVNNKPVIVKLMKSQ